MAAEDDLIQTEGGARSGPSPGANGQARDSGLAEIEIPEFDDGTGDPFELPADAAESEPNAGSSAEGAEFGLEPFLHGAEKKFGSVLFISALVFLLAGFLILRATGLQMGTILGSLARAGWALGLLAVSLVGLVYGLLGFTSSRVSALEGHHLEADRMRQRAEEEEQKAKRANDANQAAILRLMNELQVIAEGDLTQEATVTEDITGAIADSVNYTLEELRDLVARVQRAATRVAQTTSRVDAVSADLMASSQDQLRAIQATGQAVLSVAAHVNDLSGRAREAAEVAGKSRAAATGGLAAVRNTIDGMNGIRGHIQDTAKRLKRLGESSQQVSDISQLISGITEQTNVLALNAAIQASSSGTSSHGFAIVAEEVQRLAERSADALRQITVLVETIQLDTQDAITAMEASTRQVVDGAELTDKAGRALVDIDQISQELASLIEDISTAATQESEQANEVATSIQEIFEVTENNEKSTSANAHEIGKLTAVADELRHAVARFKIN